MPATSIEATVQRSGAARPANLRSTPTLSTPRSERAADPPRAEEARGASYLAVLTALFSREAGEEVELQRVFAAFGVVLSAGLLEAGLALRVPLLTILGTLASIIALAAAVLPRAQRRNAPPREAPPPQGIAAARSSARSHIRR